MNTFPSQLNAYPAVVPYVAKIPARLRQGDSAQWIDTPFTDVNDVRYDSGTHTLKYTLAGPISAPLVLTATRSGSNWQTSIDSTASATLVPGTYWWSAQAFATGVRVTLTEGELIVDADLALVGANYDNRTVAEKALAAAEAALSTFQASGGRVQHYVIGNRQMTFQNDAAILDIVKYWRARVVSEQMQANGGLGRQILTRFQRAR